MASVIKRLIFFIGLLGIILGYLLNEFSQKYQGLYRSLQYRNMKVEEALIQPYSDLLTMVIAVFVCGLFIYLIKNKASLQSEKGLQVFLLIIASGQSFKYLLMNNTYEMGRYGLLLGYSLVMVYSGLRLIERR